MSLYSYSPGGETFKIKENKLYKNKNINELNIIIEIHIK